MKIQKSRLAAILTVLVLVCSMAATMVIPASADEVTQTFYYVESVHMSALAPAVWKAAGCDAEHGSGDWQAVVQKLGAYSDGLLSEDKSVFLLDYNYIPYFCEQHGLVCTENNILSWEPEEYYGDHEYFAVPIDTSNMEYDSDIDYELVFHSAASSGSDTPVETASSGLASIVNKEMLSGVLDEVINLLPVVIPVMIGFIGLRKGISFLQSVLHSA